MWFTLLRQATAPEYPGPALLLTSSLSVAPLSALILPPATSLARIPGKIPVVVSASLSPSRVTRGEISRLSWDHTVARRTFRLTPTPLQVSGFGIAWVRLPEVIGTSLAAPACPRPHGPG